MVPPQIDPALPQIKPALPQITLVASETVRKGSMCGTAGLMCGGTGSAGRIGRSDRPDGERQEWGAAGPEEREEWLSLWCRRRRAGV